MSCLRPARPAHPNCIHIASPTLLLALSPCSLIQPHRSRASVECRFYTPRPKGFTVLYNWIVPVNAKSCRLITHTVDTQPLPGFVKWLVALRPRWFDHLVLSAVFDGDLVRNHLDHLISFAILHLILDAWVAIHVSVLCITASTALSGNFLLTSEGDIICRVHQLSVRSIALMLMQSTHCCAGRDRVP